MAEKEIGCGLRIKQSIEMNTFKMGSQSLLENLKTNFEDLLTFWDELPVYKK